MLDSDVNSFLDNSASDLLVDDDSDGSRIYVEDSSSSSVVPLVGHTLMLRSIDNDIDNISDFVVGKGLGDVDGSVLFESFSEFISSFSPITVAVGHSESQNIKINLLLIFSLKLRKYKNIFPRLSKTEIPTLKLSHYLYFPFRSTVLFFKEIQRITT